MGVKSFKKIIQKPTYEEGAVKPGKESPVSQPLFVSDRFLCLIVFLRYGQRRKKNPSEIVL